MRKIARSKTLLVGVLLLFGAYFPGMAQSAGSSFDKQKLDRYLSKLVDKDKFMGAVAIDSAGTEIYNFSGGFIDASQNKTANRTSKYRIGSVTKTITATMIFQLIEEGKLSLDTKLSEFYPELPQASNISVEHMLRHQTGLYNFTNAEDYPNWMTEKRSKEQLLELFRDYDPQFEPGAKTSYSNTNFVLLGFIIEDITNDTYAAQLQKRIVEPLGLAHTYYGDTIQSDNNEAISFKYGQHSWTVAPETNMSIPGGAGAIVSTPAELTNFIRALFKGELVSEKSLNKMIAIQQGMGMGLMKIPFDNTFAYGHNGGIDGFRSNLSYFPQEDVALAVTELATFWWTPS